MPSVFPRTPAPGGAALSASDLVPFGAFVTVSPFGKVTRAAVNGGADFGPDTPGTTTGGLNEAGVALKAAGGGTVYLLGGIANAIVVSSPVVFYDSVNYVGDGVTVQAATGLMNPFATDPASAYYSGMIAGLTLDGGAVPGTTVLTLVSSQKSTFADLVLRNAGVAGIAPTGSPFTYTNGSPIPQLLQVVGGTVSSIDSNGIAGAPTSGLFTILPGKSLVVAYSAPPRISQLGTGLLMTCSDAVVPHDGLAKTCGGNTFVSLAVTACAAAVHLSGTPEPLAQVTNNVFLNLVQDAAKVAGVAGAALVIANNCDSNNFYRAKLAVGAHVNMTGLAINTYAPNAEATIYQNVISYLSIDSAHAPGQTGIALGRNTSKPNRVEMYFPQPMLETPVRFLNPIAHAFVRDQHNAVHHVNGAKGRTGSAWKPEAYPGNGAPFRNDDYFPMLLTVQGGGVSAIALNGQDLGVAAGTFPLKPGDVLVCTSTADPPVFRSMLTTG